MLGFSTLRRAITGLANAISGLQTTVEEVNAHLRSRLALDADDDLDVSHVRRLPTSGEPEADGGENGEAVPVAGGKRKGKSNG